MFLPSAPAFVAAAISVLMAVVSILRGRRSLAEWAFAAGMVLLGAEATCTGMTLRSTTPEDIRRWLTWSHMLKPFLPVVWLLFSVTYARGNAATFFIHRRALLAVTFVAACVLAGFFHAGMVVEVAADESAASLGPAGLIVHICVLVGFIFVLVDLERTYRTAVGTARWRIKYMLLGLMVYFIVRVFTSSQVLLHSALDLSIVGIQPGALLITQVLILRSLLRPGHFTADLYPSQAMLRGSVTVILAGSYLLVVGVLAKLVSYLGTTAYFPLQAFVVLISLVLLALGLQSDHVRMRVRRFVSRHFKRPHVDTRTTWQKFATHGTAANDLPTLCRDVVALIADTFEVLSVTVWLVHERKDALTLAASSTHSTQGADEPAPDAAAVAAMIAHFQQHPEPVDLETVRAPWTEALRNWHPNAFPTGGHRVCVPLVGRGEMLGLITLGDRVGGEIFATADLDVFKCVGDHVAASVLNAQLAQRLLQARELESFQLMATFFVHDLKNAASSLTLLVRNLPEHFNDPEFRADALRGCTKSVAHMNDLISRLTDLRQELRVNPVATDLSAFVARVVADFPAPSGITVKTGFAPDVTALLDEEQMRKVLSNLLLNAREAIGTSGEIRVTTSVTGRSAGLTVTDTGCGMSPEFLRKSLFRPFQTTKQRGLGIGMFQSKMIVEAHGGRIDVDSAPGRGTTFRLTLPCPASRP